MTSIAASEPKEISTAGAARKAAALLFSPAMTAALLSGVIAIVVAFVGLLPTLQAQRHEKQLEIRTELAADMGKSFTMAVGAAQRVASGLIYGPTGNRARNAAVVQNAYNSGLGQWQIDGSRIMAELSARYPESPIVREWALYRLAVTRFYRLSAVLPPGERPEFISKLRTYFKYMRATAPWAVNAVPRDERVNWTRLEQNRKFKRSIEYRRTYDQLSASFLSLGDAFVEEMLKLRPLI
jgi:hypothetical protein